MDAAMDKPLLTPTLHIEVLMNSKQARGKTPSERELCAKHISEWISSAWESVEVGQKLESEVESIPFPKAVATQVEAIVVSGFTGPPRFSNEGFYDIEQCILDVKAYRLLPLEEKNGRRTIRQNDEMQHVRATSLPNIAMHEDWDSLIFDDSLAEHLLRYLTRMISITQSAGLNLRRMNFNRTCLLHGPPGSGKSTLCRALAQKLSIRLIEQFPSSLLVQIDTNALLSKYFSESGKLISSTFDHILDTARTTNSLVCVVLDEVETVAGSRGKVTNGGDCNDSLRATNQLLAALDRLRDTPNVFVLCTSNLVEAIDPAFVDRMDIKQFIPCPSSTAIYEIFRSCLNELIRSGTIDVDTTPQTPPSPDRSTREGSADLDWTLITNIPEWAEMLQRLPLQPESPGSKVWALAQRCVGFSGRALRRLPVLGLAMYTWGGACALSEAVAALEAAVVQELVIVERTG